MMVANTSDQAVERRVVEVDELERRILESAAGVRLDREEAERLYASVLEHKWYLGERLERDVGLRVAAVDFFEHVRPSKGNAKPKRRITFSPDPVRWLEASLSDVVRCLGVQRPYGPC